MTNLGRLEKVNLREVWSSEPGDFTPWLAGEDNIGLLAQTIGLELELDSTEKNVGPFRADIVCKDTLNGSWVLIENQLERTDHNHLGQLLTYAAGLDAVTIIWIAEQFTDEHRAALDWLNDVTGSELNLFGLEIELWQIGSSAIAPKFNVISQPNDWKKNISATKDISDTQQLNLDYWTSFRDYLQDKNSHFQVRSPRPTYLYEFAIGRTGFRLRATIGMSEGFIKLQLIITHDSAKSFFNSLLEDQEAIERELGLVSKLEWRELPDNKQSDIMITRDNVNPKDRNNWPEYHTWLQDSLESFHRVFAPRIAQLSPEDFIDSNDMDVDTF